MHPLASAEGTVHIVGDEWYRISTREDVSAAPDRTMRSYGTLDAFEGDVFIDTGTTTGVVDVVVEEWAAEPALEVTGGGFAEVVETSVSFDAARLRVVAASGPEVLALDLGSGTGDYRLRLYSQFLTPRHQTHLLRVWPAPAAREWNYHLDDVGRPVPRPDRNATESLTVSMTHEQANTLFMEAQEMALLETQKGDIDDIVEDCLRIRDIVGYRAEPTGDVTLALTARQWKVALAVLGHRGTAVIEADWAQALRRTHDVIDSQIGNRLPPGRVYGL